MSAMLDVPCIYASPLFCLARYTNHIAKLRLTDLIDDVANMLQLAALDTGKYNPVRR